MLINDVAKTFCHLHSFYEFFFYPYCQYFLQISKPPRVSKYDKRNFKYIKTQLICLEPIAYLQNSRINSCLISRSFLTSFDKKVSSAYMEMFDVLIVLGKSFKYRINSKGPNIESCGTLHVTNFCEDIFSLTRQHRVRWERYETKKQSSLLLIPYLFSFLIRVSWLTVLKAFLMSKNTTEFSLPLSVLIRQLSMLLFKAKTVERSDLKPHCWLPKIPLSTK